MKAESADQGLCRSIGKAEEQSASSTLLVLGQCGARERAAQVIIDFVYPAPQRILIPAL